LSNDSGQKSKFSGNSGFNRITIISFIISRLIVVSHLFFIKHLLTAGFFEPEPIGAQFIKKQPIVFFDFLKNKIKACFLLSISLRL